MSSLSVICLPVDKTPSIEMFIPRSMFTEPEEVNAKPPYANVAGHVISNRN